MNFHLKSAPRALMTVKPVPNALVPIRPQPTKKPLYKKSKSVYKVKPKP